MTKSGFTRDEDAVMDLLRRAWEQFLRIDRVHPDELDEFRRSIHHLQGLMGLRILTRDYPEVWCQAHNTTAAVLENEGWQRIVENITTPLAPPAKIELGSANTNPITAPSGPPPISQVRPSPPAPSNPPSSGSMTKGG